MLRGSLKRDEKETKHMKLSTELLLANLLANLVILGALWYTALHGQLAITFILFALMIAIRVWGIFALRKERAEERAAVKARIRAIIDRKFKGAP
jgi:fatty acid desaturase